MSVTKVKTLKALKSKLKKELPSQISKVISSYEDFAGQPVPDDAKGFTAHHNACKSAVGKAEKPVKHGRWEGDEGAAEAAPAAEGGKILVGAKKGDEREEEEEN